MVKTLLVSTNEQNTVLEALRQGTRIDGRQLTDTRNLEIKFGEELGYVSVRLGRTCCFACVSAQVVSPRMDDPSEQGVILFNTEISPMSDPYIDTSRISEQELIVSRMVDKSIKRSNAIDTESLCIIAGEKVWHVQVDIRIIDNNGNMIDCACIAALAALLHFRRPAVTIEDGVVTVHSTFDKNPVPLTIYHAPFSVTFAFFEQGAMYVLDPSLHEEVHQSGTLTIAANVHGEVCAVSHAGGARLPKHKLLQFIQQASTTVMHMSNTVMSALKADYQKRGIQVHMSHIFGHLNEQHK